MTQPAAETAPSRSAHLILGLAVALSAVPLILLGRTEGLGYDALWHVFIARQDDPRILWDEVQWTAHPPLFFLCVKAAVALFGTGPLAYRLIPIAGTIASTWLVGRIVHKATGRRWLPAAAALAFGASLTVVTIGLDVRSYSLATALMLAAFLALLDLAERGLAGPTRARVVFALAASLGLLTHYGTALFLLSCFAALLALAAIDGEFRRRLATAGRRRWRANLLTFGTPPAVLAGIYAVHITVWSKRSMPHLPPFLFEPGREGALAFVWRNTRALFELFLPPLSYGSPASTRTVAGPGLSGPAAAVLAVALLAAVGWLALRRRRDGGGEIARRVPPLLLAILTALIVALALLRRYPYGGMLRHQYFLFPLAVIVLALLIDAVARRSRRRIGGLAVALLALAGLLNAANWLSHLQPTRFRPHPHQVRRLHRWFPAPEAVFVDQFSLILLFMHYHERPWTFVRRVRGHGPIEVWRVGAGDPPGPDGAGGTGGFYVCRDQGQWLLDLSWPVTYQRMSRCLDATRAERLAVFRPQQWETTASWPVARTRELCVEPARAAGLVPEKVVLHEQDVYATFTRD